MRKLSFLLVMLLLTAAQVLAQRTITGKVTSADDGGGIPGVTVLVKGTSNGVLTDLDGKYSISVPKDATALQFSFIGMTTQEVMLTASNLVDVVMQSEAQNIEGVVVTALGITREKKSLGYATQEVKGDAVSTVKSTNFMNNLSGKVTGVQIKKNNNMGGSTNVIVRGSKSLTGNNQVLYVVDGVPIINNIGSFANQATAGVGYDYGNAASDINPEDIESVNVLKGSAATALYGSRAAAGVVMITTKKGKIGKAGEKGSIGVSLNSNFMISSIDKSTFPTYQDQYGAGYGQFYGPDGNAWFDQRTTSGALTGSDTDPLVDWVPTTEDASYGAKFDGHEVWGWYSVDPASPWYKQSKPWVNAANGAITFFEKPVTYANTVAIDKSTETGTMRLAYTNYNTTGLMPNSKLAKNNVLLNGTWNITDKLTIAASVDYIQQKATGRNSTGYNDNILSNMRQWAQTNLDYADQKQAYELTGRNLTWNYNAALNYPIYTDNPYFQRYKNYQNDTRTRTIGYASANYKITDWLEAYGRFSADSYSEFQEERRAVGSVATTFGVSRTSQKSGYMRRDNTSSEYNMDAMLNFKKKISESFNLNGLLGINERRTTNSFFSSSTNGGLRVPDIYSIQNTIDAPPYPSESIQKIGMRSQYASVSIGYQDFLFLDGTLRRDYSSTLKEDNNKYLYPSVSAAFIFSKLYSPEWLSLGKFRLNYAEVGSGTGYDQLINTYVVNQPMNGANNANPAVKKNPDLVPERTKSWETGLEMNFFDSRLGVDIALYKSNSYNQIMTIPISQTAGYSSLVVNAGDIENKGVEIAITGTPVRKGDFRWDVMLNWSKNKNMVVELYSDPTTGNKITNLVLGSFQGGITINATEGQPYGVIKGKDYTYDANGNKIISAASGLPVKSTTATEIIGNNTPDYLTGLNNAFSYKNVTLSFLIDMQKGGDIFSLDMYYGMSSGLYPETAGANDLGNPVRDPIVGDPGAYGAESGGYIIEGVNVDANGVSTPNQTRVDATTADGWGYAVEPQRAFVYDASYVKLREVALSYSLPSDLLKKTFLKGVTLSAVGSNLWIMSKNLPYADPESGLSAGNLQGYTIGSLPTTRDFSFNLKLNF
jgi:TonB-linked SusC/RagA family outer membrane protein